MNNSSRPIVILGATGQLAQGLAKKAVQSQLPVRVISRSEADLHDLDSCLELLDELSPSVLINAAAHTNVDWCELHQEEAHWVNAIAPGELAKWCAENDCYFVHFSTDYVFDGKKGSPYIETDSVNPLSWYGRTKLESEDAVSESGANNLIARVSWLYSNYRPSFVHALIDQAEKWKNGEKLDGQGIKVVADQIGSPTSVESLAEQLIAMIQRRVSGLYHVACSGSTSRCEMAQLLSSELGLDVPFLPCTTSEFPRPAPRPLYSALQSKRLETEKSYLMPSWDAALREFARKTWPLVRS